MKNNQTILKAVFQFFSSILLIGALLLPAAVLAYPIDGFEQTGIRRLRQTQLVMSGVEKGSKIPSGATLGMDQITLKLESKAIDLSLTGPAIDTALQEKIASLFPNRDESYSLAVLDISPGRPVRLAMRQAHRRFAVGSVGKLAIAAGLFTELQRLYPDSLENRRALLKNRMVMAGPWIETDHHSIPVFFPETGSFSSRPVKQGDAFSLYEWADHMISASANSAASTLWKELVLMRHFGAAYPPAREVENSFFTTTSKKRLSDLAAAVVNQPLIQAGITREEFHLGSFFTEGGKRLIPGEGNSQASPYGLLKYMIAMEQGKIVDPWSSLEIKRLMYSTARRIRYASSPALANAAVYFKSGSLYKCIPEPEFSCKKYMGNKENIMNSVAIVEHSDSRVYMVALMTNVLKKNSAVDHQTLATEIDAILKK